jgi:hypothetical protein
MTNARRHGGPRRGERSGRYRAIRMQIPHAKGPRVGEPTELDKESVLRPRRPSFRQLSGITVDAANVAIARLEKSAVETTRLDWAIVVDGGDG